VLFGKHIDSIEMSKNVNTLLQPIIESLANKCSDIVSPEEMLRLKKYRIHVSEDDYKLIEDNKIKQRSSFQPSFLSKFALFACDSAFYLVQSGMPELISKIGQEMGYLGLDNEDNEALLYLFLSQANIQPSESVSAGEIYNMVFTNQDKEGEVYREVVEKFFPQVNIYKIESAKIPVDHVDDYFLKQLTLKYICALFHEKPFTPVKLSSDTISLFDKLSDDAGHLVPIDNLVQSILAYRWNFVFLDLYRCIERLYVIGWVLDYSNCFGSSLDKAAVHEKLLERYVQHHEDEIIKYLFSLLDASLLTELDSIRGKTEYSDFIYSLRNSIVHYQTNDVSFSDTEWDVIVKFLLKAIDDLYNKLEVEIKTLGDKDFKKDKTVNP